ncbi:arfaptin-1 isoform X1 [Conger conger]|uniref:arfaptin-1 isoform X1 n=2 Tax=Conger conger TaxID=82655 RepID=UPI002A5A247E|nr:arfaptin-1 isoform X1 [Conger conger]XP_061100956.1 arfaptin-1 isoform X1 [Conger conger]XP_061100957.1 arfaptin-1 isoform X1 [Conger conger]
MSHISVEADAGETQADDPRVDNEATISDNEETVNYNEETLTDKKEMQNINEEALNYNEDGQISNDGALTDAGDVEKEYEDVQIHDEDDNEIHNEEALKNDGEDAVKGIVHTPKGEGQTQMDSEDAEAERKSEMAEDSPRSAAAEIPVTSNGDSEESLGDVFQSDPSLSGGVGLSDTHITSSNYGSTTEGIIEAGPYKGSTSEPTSPAVLPSPTAAGRLARSVSDSRTETGRMKTQAKGGALVLADDMKNPAMEKLELVRKWSINTYKCTRQILSEKLGRGSRTVDLELEAQIEILRDNKRKYEHVVKLAQTLANQLFQMIQTQRQLGDAFADLSLKSLELHEEFGFNADTQKLLSKNGETLLGAINFFIASVNTLVDKTIEDTMVNIKHYENARIEYDAYRTDLEELNLGPRDANTVPKIEASQQLFQIHREKYEKMRNDVAVKLKFLEENKVKVLHNQLILFHNAIAAYYAGNQQQLEQTLKQFHIKLKLPGGDRPSWLEEQH